ncbi:hypothetical protein GCM10027321_17730 [Massilia terrae]|uniref:Uncharacterized protein n=1 Tax=Massilia terrae TaxID=1811224 RepID=A0ABT2CW17_9BURK|nr:hypothetical protein [Massilia terrae]MCS0658157.1 hypothetical protein [Massilia terrae]
MQSILEQPIPDSEDHRRRERSSFLAKVLVAVLFWFLNLGYLGVNLFDMKPGSIMLFRVAALVAIAGLLARGVEIRKGERLLFVYLLLMAIGALTSSLSLNMVFILLVCFAVRSIQIRSLASTSTFVLGATILLVLALIQFGYVENGTDVVGIAAELGDDERTRMTFGFRNVNAFSGVVTAFCLLLMFSGKRVVLRAASAVMVSYIFYKYTDSRTMLLATCSFIVFSLVFLIFVAHRRLFYIVSVVLIAVPIALSILAATVLDKFPLIDLIFSGRFSFMAEYLNSLPFYRVLIGGVDPPEALTIDNAFALMVGAFGVPFMAYLVWRIFCVIRECALVRDYRTYSFVLSFWLFSFSESNILRPESLICLVFWAIVFNQNLQKITTREEGEIYEGCTG